LIEGLFQSGSVQSLERLVQFTGRRHTVLANNIANISTPRFRPGDLDADAFQAELGRAIDDRRARGGGRLELRDSEQLRFKADRILATSSPTDQNILFHDRNNRDLERMMQSLAENTLAHSAGVQMLRNEFDLLETAIRERA